jgi:hypothetical protein
MTVTEIVNDLLEYNMITAKAALVLLTAESKAQAFDRKNTNQVFQPYHGVPNGGTSNPYYVSTTTNDPIAGTTTSNDILSAGGNNLINNK